MNGSSSNATPALPVALGSLGRVLTRLEALRERDRWLVLGAGLLLLAGAEALLVWPMAQRRQAIEQAALDEAQQAADAESAAAAQADASDGALRARLEVLGTELAALGAGPAKGQPLGAWLQRTLQGLPVQLAGLRDAGVVAIDPAVAAADGAAVVAAADAAAAPDAAASAAAVPVYHHRWELQLHGSFEATLAAVQTLEQRVAPLRLERLQLRGRADGSVEATLTLGVIGLERTWLQL